MQHVFAHLNLPMANSIDEARKTIQEIIHFYPEMEEKIEAMI